MKKLLLLLLLLPALALADKIPDELTEADQLRLQVAALQAELAQSQAELAKAQANVTACRILAVKYHMETGDQYQSGKIQRKAVAKPAPATPTTPKR